jgi:hypothetical protein
MFSILSNKFSIFILLIFIHISLIGQRVLNTNTNVWLNYTGTFKISNHWSVYAESQLRRSEGISTPQQFLIRPAMQYNFDNNNSMSLGYLFVHTNVYGSQPALSAFGENRTWQQLQIRSQNGPFEIVNRLRLEQRWVNVPVKDATGIAKEGGPVYSNRMRIQNKISLPFKGKQIVDKSFYAMIGDEVMINFGNNVKGNVFDQNRIFGGLGYRIPKIGRMEAGYLYQKIFKGDGVKVEGNNTITLSLIHNISLISNKN